MYFPHPVLFKYVASLLFVLLLPYGLFIPYKLTLMCPHSLPLKQSPSPSVQMTPGGMHWPQKTNIMSMEEEDLADQESLAVSSFTVQAIRSTILKIVFAPKAMTIAQSLMLGSLISHLPTIFQP